MNRGGSIGNAKAYIQKLCQKKGFVYIGTAEIIIPENYIALYDAPSEEDARKIVRKTQPQIENAAAAIKAARPFSDKKAGIKGRLASSMVNIIFYRFIVKAKKFTADRRCTGCGGCVKACPLNNIHLDSGRPVWGNSCTHCMACICTCPCTAIEYGKTVLGRSGINVRRTVRGGRFVKNKTL